jgi:subtilisin-like proprotein convertase family protein
MNLKRILLAGATVVMFTTMSGRSPAATATWSADFSPALVIPDNDPTGVADTETLTIPSVNHLVGLEVNLDIVGGFNGDYYVYLRHGDTGFAVLLNRVGRSTANPFGYADKGLDITLSDAASNGDVHTYQTLINPNGGSLTGEWRPDGRNADPSVVLDSTPQTALLNSFNGMDPNGPWTLFVSDNSPLGIGTLAGWGLTVTAETLPAASVPEGGATLSLLLLRWAILWLQRRCDKGLE